MISSKTADMDGFYLNLFKIVRFNRKADPPKQESHLLDLLDISLGATSISNPNDAWGMSRPQVIYYFILFKSIDLLPICYIFSPRPIRGPITKPLHPRLILGIQEALLPRHLVPREQQALKAGFLAPNRLHLAPRLSQPGCRTVPLPSRRSLPTVMELRLMRG